MKKLLTLLLTLLMVFTLVGCNSKQDTPIVNELEQQQEVVEPINEDEPIVGGFVDAEDDTLTEELKDIFNKALEGLMGASYEPVELVATQVVAGTNYKFLANGTKTTNPITKGTYYITIYEDLQGNVELLDIETIEEKQEETPKQDVSQMSFWVVFYDQYGNELQREALKYGTVPEYKSWLPEGFDKWVYKKSGKDVGSFKSITGNTYYQAVCCQRYYDSSNTNDNVTNDILPKGTTIFLNTETSGYKEYTVIKVKDNIVTLLNRDYTVKSKYCADYGNIPSSYNGTLIDDAMTTFYNGLSSTVKNAIIEQNIDINGYTYSSGFDLSSKQYVETISRNVYSLGFEDIYNYFSGIGSTEQMKDLFNLLIRNDNFDNIILRDNINNDSEHRMVMYAGGYLSYNVIPWNYNFYFAPAFTIDLSKPGISYSIKPTMPKKGDIITLNDNNRYRVLDINATDAKVLAMSSINTKKYWTTNQTIEPSSGVLGTKYDGSDLDNYLENTWYAGLQSSQPEMYAAIKSTSTINQNKYSWNEGYDMFSVVNGVYGDFIGYYLTGGSFTSLNDRHVYVLGIQDIVDYLGDQFSVNNTKEMFFGDATPTTNDIWLNSADSGDVTKAYYYSTQEGRVYVSSTTQEKDVRPVFTIDLLSNGVEFNIE